MDAYQGEIIYWAARYATSLLPRADLMQEGRIAAWQGRSIRNAMRDAVRRQARLIYIPARLSDTRKFPANAEPFEACYEFPSDDWTESADTRMDTQRLLQCLSQRQRDVLRAVVWEEKTFEEAAASLHISPSAAYQNYTYAIWRLRKECGGRP
jgi:RNA polymerase sigma factor (sigma-70 family)